MAQDRQEAVELEGAIVDRLSGRQSDEFSVETDLSFEERINLFEETEVELMRAERALDESINKADVFGTPKDVQKAIQILRDSAQFHAGRIKASELTAAVEAGKVHGDVADAVKSRWSEREATPDYLALYEATKSQSSEINRDIENDLDMADDD